MRSAVARVLRRLSQWIDSPYTSRSICPTYTRDLDAIVTDICVTVAERGLPVQSWYLEKEGMFVIFLTTVEADPKRIIGALKDTVKHVEAAERRRER